MEEVRADPHRHLWSNPDILARVLRHGKTTKFHKTDFSFGPTAATRAEARAPRGLMAVNGRSKCFDMMYAGTREALRVKHNAAR